MTSLPLPLQPVVIQLQAFIGSSDYSTQPLFNYQNADALQGTFANSKGIGLPVGGPDMYVDIFGITAATNILFVSIQDTTPIPQSFSVYIVDDMADMIPIGAGGIFLWTPNMTVSPFYIHNPNATEGFVQVSWINN
jgi:hypothetical protein